MESEIKMIPRCGIIERGRIATIGFAMSTWRAFCEAVHAVALALWLGFVVAAGAFAAMVFGVSKGLSPRLPEYEAYTGEHYLIIGGKMAQTVFFAADVVQFACSMLAVVTLIALFKIRGDEARRPAMVIRASSLVVAVASVAALLVIVNPKLTTTTRLYWEAAKAGKMAEVEALRAVAADTHPYASALMVTTAIMVLAALVSGIWSIAAPQPVAAAASRGERLPEPALLRGGRA